MTTPASGRYEILEKLGEGGMGVLYRARDTRLSRTVALKMLRSDTLDDPERRARFIREARAASALNHPNIVTVYDIDETPDGSDCIAMEYVVGRSLDRVIAAGPLPLEEALRYAADVLRALAAAHAAGIIHRDVKPANVMLTASGQVKVLDFGLAKVSPGAAQSGETAAATLSRSTRPGIVLGTPAYMSPEQANGQVVDARSDVFSFGAMLYEMLSGRRPFQGESVAALLSSILRDDPPPVETLRQGIPSDVAAVVASCLAREREARFPSAGEALRALEACQARISSARTRSGARPWQIVAVVTALAVLGSLLGRQVLRASRERTARRETLPEIERLVKADKLYAAFSLARQAEPLLRGDPAFDGLWRDISLFPDVRTSPPGAEVSVKEYLDPGSEWRTLGLSPISGARVPFAYLRWRITKPGFDTPEAASLGIGPQQFTLTPAGSGPPDMVRVPGGRYAYRNARQVALDDFWLDRYEVTNRQYKAFVDQGGYREPRFWKQPFAREGRTLSREEAMALLRDGTGRPGPAGWELGSYPEGQEEYPVSGVSWYEAAAYAEFAGKSLPTFFHWYRAAELGIVSDILLLSNFGGEGKAPVGRYQGIGPFGAYDQAGNVREWSWNAAAASEKHYTLGGAWNDPTYLYQGPELVTPWDRSPTQGIRLVHYTAPPAAETLAPVEYWTSSRDYTREKPVAEDVFSAYRSLYAYDRTPLDARLEATDDASPHWRRETIEFAAAYGGERVRVHLFLPKSHPPPHQVVVYFPPSSALTIRSSEDLGLREFSYLVRSGRAVLFPVYKGTFERRLASGTGSPNLDRDMAIHWHKDLARSLDYLETRPDLRSDRVGFLGLSMGVQPGLLSAGLDSRLRALVLLAGGLFTGSEPGETDPLNFAPRITAPVLLIAGRDDFRFPLEVSQEPLMRLLGSKHKRHYVFEGGHVPPRQQEVIREALDWFDRYLGPV